MLNALLATLTFFKLPNLKIKTEHTFKYKILNTLSSLKCYIGKIFKLVVM